MAMVKQFASVKRFSVSRMLDFSELLQDCHFSSSIASIGLGIKVAFNQVFSLISVLPFPCSGL